MISWIKDNFRLKNFLILSLVILVIVGFIKGPSWYKLIIGSQYEDVVEAKGTNIVAKKSPFKQYLFMKKVINTSNAPKALGPYSQGIMVNGMLFVSGQIPINPSTNELLKGDIQEQTRQIMVNILAILKEADMNFSNVVKTSIFLSDMNNFGKVNEVYGTYFKENPPARECMQASRLPKNADIEISVIAAK